MKKNSNYTWYVAIIIAFVAGYLFGQGGQTVPKEQADNSSQTEETQTDASMKDGENVTVEVDLGDSENKNNPTDLRLSGYALEDGGVHLEWVLPDNRRQPEHYMIVRGEEENPVHDGKHFWFRQPGSRNEVNWKDVPKGEYYFRLCVLEDEKCVEYSNNVQLKVQKAD